MAALEHARMRLNNVLQGPLRDRRLTWEDYSEGPPHNVTWTSIAYLNNIEWGRGTGPSRGAAKENAARAVLDALVTDGLIAAA
ncbi:hypothetical protein NEOLEDRAFT_1099326 [Neolentinus lepideus HHB14362 ss-1]|uniref:DRBM domain-containing protein n=1 Tax=Neolentinus lepideus HHB14362 ss-1 TaxID=1314782 RepID=A0A165PRC9_9AGAM|nr:hypothetical protein NEOLEDRAFT_1099326 [Neolentinus lepideus HHB14362 ss-1]